MAKKSPNERASPNEILIGECRNQTQITKNKWRRNGRLYYGSLFSDVTNARDKSPIGLTQIDYSIEPDVTATPLQNIIKSIIDTKVSQMAANKVRAGVLPNGHVHFSTRRKARVFRKVIDRFFQDNNIHKLTASVWRSALIFERAYLWVDSFTNKCYELFPWECGTIDIEDRFTNTKCLIKLDYYPTTLIKQYAPKFDKQSLFNRLELFYDTINHSCQVFVNGNLENTIKYDGDLIPVIKMESTKSINSNRTISVVDELFGFQEMLNNVNAVINEAAGLAPGFVVIGPESDEVDEIEVSNGNGRYIGYRPGTSAPIHFETPRFIDPEWFELREAIVRSAYEMMGVSQLSAQNRNPLGENASGKALQTMDNIEDQRHQIELDQFIKTQQEVAKLIILTFNEDTELSDGLTIKELKEDFDNYKLEFVSLSWMSRDPQTRYQEIQNLISIGLIQPGKALELMEFGDLTTAYDMGSAINDAIDTMIDKALEQDIYEFPAQFMHPQDAITAILTEMNQEYASQLPEVEERLAKLKKLLEIIKNFITSPGIDLIVPQIDSIDEEANNLLQGGQI